MVKILAIGRDMPSIESRRDRRPHPGSASNREFSAKPGLARIGKCFGCQLAL
jgi:hypothetical protein